MKRSRPPDPPELPDTARPRWPAWYAPMALLASLGAITVLAFPLLPVILVSGAGETLEAVALLVLLLLQDGILMGAAVLFASFKRRPPLWHFGLRSTRFWPTLGWTALGFGLLLGFEIGYVELLDVDETNVEELGGGNVAAAIAVGLAVILVAPVSEEFFFRAFFYRALRSRLRIWSASLIDGLVFGALHFQGPDTALILPVIVVFGVGLCLIYERTGSLPAVIAIHAAFNTIASLGVFPVVAVVVGALVLLGCLLAARRSAPDPSPMPA